LRDQILGRKARGDLANVAIEKVRCGELLDDLMEYAHSNLKASTVRVFKWCIEANIRPFFGHLEVSAVTSEKLRE
jgi:hypothetical protein